MPGKSASPTSDTTARCPDDPNLDRKCVMGVGLRSREEREKKRAIIVYFTARLILPFVEAFNSENRR